MSSIRHSVALRLALICGSLVIVSVLILSSAFYLGTIVVLARNIDAKIVDIARRFELEAQQHGLLSLARRIEQTLIDGVDSDAEIILLISADQKKLAGHRSHRLERPGHHHDGRRSRTARGVQLSLQTV